MITNVAVIGAGTMGNGITHVFAQKGFRVHLIDVSQLQLDKALESINKNMDRQIAKNFLSEAEKTNAINNITTFTSLIEGVQTADLVVEAATENIDLKLKIFKQLDEAAPANCILATNTSSISITKISSVTQRPQRVIGMHFMNPVPVMKLV
ncbi:MAG: 3-hydroxyacyl-CoA dehydrogenase NAD-binding domain-containing protein, partial [Ginsengibacter sp.]